MKHQSIGIPNGVAVVSRPGRRGPRFTTEKIEQRIQEANEERTAKRLIRVSQRKDLADNSRLEAELQKQESVIRLRDSLLQNLARQENISKRLCPGNEAGSGEKQKRNFDQMKREIMEALYVLV
jgi:hypothetical protein